jgi:hypothetical protein
MERAMPRLNSGLAVLLMVAAGVVADLPSARADDEPSEQERAEQYAREGVERLLRALDLLIESIPQYEMPVIDENGDIIIRRRRGPVPDQPRPSPEEPEADRTDT